VDGEWQFGIRFSSFFFLQKNSGLQIAIHFLDYISSRCPLLVKRCFRNRIETSNFKQLGLVQVKSGSQLQIQDRHYGPSKKKKIPPELTNRYVKNEAFIVVVFDNILTLLLTIRITILSDCCCCCFQTHSHPTGSALNMHPLANCQCGNASFNSISIFKSYSNIWTFKYLSTSKLEYPTIQIFEYQHI